MSPPHVRDPKNELIEQFGITVSESPDVIPPVVTTTVQVDLNDGKLTILADETIDVNPTSLLDLSKIHIENMTNDAFITLTGAQSISTTETTSLTVFLNEEQRVKAIEKSNTPGGDATQLFLRVETDAMIDMAGGRNDQEFVHVLSANYIN